MKLIDNVAFNDRRWDEFRLFHQYSIGGKIIRFDDGGIVVLPDGYNLSFGPSDYCIYPQYGYAVVHTSSMGWTKPHFDILDPETYLPLTQSALSKPNQSTTEGQLLLVDFRHCMAVRFVTRGYGRSRNMDVEKEFTQFVPPHVRQTGGVYYPHEMAKPVGHSVRVTSPTKYSAEQKKRIYDLIDASRAWFTMVVADGSSASFLDSPHNRLLLIAKFGDTLRQHVNRYTSLSDVMSSEVIDKTFKDTDPLLRYRLATRKLVWTRDSVDHDWLPIKIHAGGLANNNT